MGGGWRVRADQHFCGHKQSDGHGEFLKNNPHAPASAGAFLLRKNKLKIIENSLK